MTDGGLQHVVIGAGRRGLAAGRTLLRELPAAGLLVVEQAARPGGSLHTQRSEGFVGELGRFAFTAAEFAAASAPLESPPPAQSTLPAAASGWLWRGGTLVSTPLPEPLVAPRGGCEDLAQAYRRELGLALRLGRKVDALRVDGEGFAIDLGGMVPDTLHAAEVTLAVPVSIASTLLAPFDPRLAAAAERLQPDPRAVVHLGYWQSGLGDALTGYGVLAEDDAVGVEAIFCTNVFAARAQAGKALVRVELGGDVLQQDDEAVATAAAACLHRWTRLAVPPILRRVHRTTGELRDAAWIECRVRLCEVAARLPGLRLA